MLAAFDADAPLESAHAPPPAWYTDPEIHRVEMDRLFRSGPQYVAPAALPPGEGSFVTINVGGEPVIAVRGADGRIRVLANVCRHRAAALVTTPCGKADPLRCPYHGWTYRSDGTLRGAPEMEGVAAFARDAGRSSDTTLPEVSSVAVGPFVFADLSSGRGAAPATPQRTPAEACNSAGWSAGELAAEWSRAGVSDLRWVHRAVYGVACNWKVFVDNYLDGGYHVPKIHPDLHAVLDYGRYRTELHDGWNVQIAPLKPAVGGDAGAVRKGADARYYWVFPNFMVNCYDGVMDVNFVEPDGPDRCRVVYDFFFGAEADGDAAAEFVRRSVEVAERVQEEDRLVCESVQRNLHSRFAPAGPYSPRRENGQRQFHRMLAERLRAAAADSVPTSGNPSCGRA